MPRFRFRIVLLIAGAVAAVCSSSCSRGRQFYPVRGQLFVNGKPGAGVSIVFYLLDDPDPKPVNPSAIVEPDGSFTLKSYVVQDRVLRDGAPAGKYAITCVWYPPDLQKYLNAGAALPDKLQGKYSDAKTSGLEAVVAEGPTDLARLDLTIPTK